ncbi:hypothetical protein ACSBR2_006203 [Camellia fascicularis]
MGMPLELCFNSVTLQLIDVSYQQFSGYVIVDAKKQKALVLEAESNPTSKPLVIWLNGGPGCSSLGVGAFSENGPFRPSGKALVRNEYSWNKENREAPLRTACPPGVPNGVVSNFEIKAFDRCANPHVGLAAIIAAGIDGLRRHLSLPEPIGMV